jgi:hypothetical protein
VPSRAGFLAVTVVFASCGSQTAAPGAAVQTPADTPATKSVYQPLAVGNTWKYVCNHQFPIENAVLGKLRLDARTVYEFSIQIPSSPVHSVKVVQLLANDSTGTTRIYGYLLHGKPHEVTPAAIVVASPVLHQHYDYPRLGGGKVTRIFMGFENTNPTPLGTFYVAPYFESGGTHNYGYALGKGVMEEDHGPNYKYDCLIDHVTLK